MRRNELIKKIKCRKAEKVLRIESLEILVLREWDSEEEPTEEMKEGDEHWEATLNATDMDG